MILNSEPLDKIVEYTGLTIKKVEGMIKRHNKDK
jgi:hypothetical protein